MMKKLVLIAALCGIAFSAQAEEGGYMGLGLGYATQKLDLELDSDVKAHTGKLGAKIYGGYQFNENFAVEGAYHYLNKSKITWDLSDAGETSNGFLTTQGHVFSAAAVGILPLSPDFSLFGKLGAALYASKSTYQDTYNDGVTVENEHDSTRHTTLTPVVGIGAEYKIDKNMALRFEYENFGKPKLSSESTTKMKRVDMFSIGLRSTFN